MEDKFSIGGELNPLTEDLHQAVKNLSAELYAKDVHCFMELIHGEIGDITKSLQQQLLRNPKAREAMLAYQSENLQGVMREGLPRVSILSKCRESPGSGSGSSFEERLVAQRKERELATAELGFKQPLSKEENREEKATSGCNCRYQMPFAACIGLALGKVLTPVSILLKSLNSIGFVTNEDVMRRKSTLRDNLKNDSQYKVKTGASMEVAQSFCKGIGPTCGGVM
ncbi:hypothetical protein Tco_0891041 [Tanacetum coccineum]|uniref:Uncharacterized protein n=1 Tax=Tanacetum coccineum TaxID=301880 RepID=A0ABQ5C7B2_9ASTR